MWVVGTWLPMAVTEPCRKPSLDSSSAPRTRGMTLKFHVFPQMLYDAHADQFLYATFVTVSIRLRPVTLVLYVVDWKRERKEFGHVIVT